jgi:hypothetical protein
LVAKFLLYFGFKFSDAHDFSEGLAAVEVKGNYGYIDKTGHFVVPPQFDRVGKFSEGLAPVMPVIDASWAGNLAYINQRGQMVIKSM